MLRSFGAYRVASDAGRPTFSSAAVKGVGVGAGAPTFSNAAAKPAPDVEAPTCAAVRDEFAAVAATAANEMLEEMFNEASFRVGLY